MKTLWILLSFLFLPFCGTLMGNGIFKHLTLNEGLAHTDANCVVQDSSGLVWIGTYGGLQSYDGYTLQTYDYYTDDQTVFKSHNRIYDIAVLENRFWIASESGLTCFDTDVRQYVSYILKKNGKQCGIGESAFRVSTSVTEAGQHLWVKNDQGLLVFEVYGDTLSQLEWVNEEERLISKRAYNMHFHGNEAWTVCAGRLCCLKLQSGSVMMTRSYDIKSLTGSESGYIFIKDDFLYMRIPDGCYRFLIKEGDIYKDNFSFVEFHTLNAQIPKYTNGYFIVSDNGTLWCCYGGGVFEVQYPFSETPSAKFYLNNEKEGRSVKKINDLMIDKYDNLWVAASSLGVYYHALSKPFFNNLSSADFNLIGLDQNEVVSITGGAEGVYYMIVEYGSLLAYDINTEHLFYIPLPDKIEKTLYMQCVRISSDNRYLYIGTSNGIILYDIAMKTMRALELPEGNEKINTSVADLHEDIHGRLWVATWGIGLSCIDNPLGKPSLKYHLSESTDPGLASRRISALSSWKETLLICTTNGLNRIIMTPEGALKSVSTYRVDERRGKKSMSSDYIAAVDCENDSTLWVGTIGGGLDRVVLHSESDNDYTATCYTKKDGLLSNDCEVVMVDKFRRVWIGGNGLNCMNVPENRIDVYGDADGLQLNAYKINAFHKSNDGIFFMGGLSGLSYFRPELPFVSKSDYSLSFTNLSISNERIVPGKSYDGHVVIDKVLDKTTLIELTHNQNNFSISFAALGYRLSGQIVYRYRLKGFQNEWRVLDYQSNEVYFSNLPYKHYTLEVEMSSDRGNSWNQLGKNLEIHILPPIWLTWWAKALYVMAIAGIVLFLFRQYGKEQELKKENEIQKILMAQDEEKYQSKMKFFMNASHELKTPLTLVMLATEKLQRIESAGKECNTILYNVRRMLMLISELVDIRKQDLGIFKLNLEQVEMSSLVTQLYSEIYPWAENKHIQMEIYARGGKIKMDGDRNKLGKIILNLLSNAVKYTDSGGHIEVSFFKGTKQDISPCYPDSYSEGVLPEDTQFFIFKVNDTGVGISSESMHKIYERFFQINATSQTHLGSGVGLAIVKSIVLQHKGEIVVSSKRNEGSEFIVALPMYDTCKEASMEVMAKHDMADFVKEQYHELYEAATTENAGDKDAGHDYETKDDKPILLIVEDNKELQSMLKEHFAVSYNVLVADNGRIGLEKCLKFYPDAIVSDVMMPEMDGIKFCKKVKNNLSIGYIPFILLTAKDMVENQIEGYESGADLYLSKPFSIKLLEVNIQRLMKQQEIWIKKGVFSVSTGSGTSDEVLSPKIDFQDEIAKENFNAEQRRTFERVKAIIQEHIGNPELSSEFIAKQLRISRTKLYRDVKKMGIVSLADYLRNIRLEKAAELLTHTNLNITEVMNDVGFVNISHFSKTFKCKFGVPPTEYKQNN